MYYYIKEFIHYETLDEDRYIIFMSIKYMSQEDIELSTFTDECIKGHIEFSVIHNHNYELRNRIVHLAPESYVYYIHVDKYHRGRGYGTILLESMMNFLREKFNVYKISLEDMSDFSGLKNCIYIKNNFKYRKDGIMMDKYYIT